MLGPLSFSPGTSLPDLRLAPSSGTAGQAQQASGGGDDFAGVLKGFMTQAANTVREGEAAAIAGVQGSMPLQTVVDRVMAAERTLQAAVAVRDKVVSSYLEISRMQI